jgi:hypothetical protein
MVLYVAVPLPLVPATTPVDACALFLELLDRWLNLSYYTSPLPPSIACVNITFEGG